MSKMGRLAYCYSHIYYPALYCTDEVSPQTTRGGVAGVDNVIVTCSIIAADYDPGDGTFWKINGSVYGLPVASQCVMKYHVILLLW